MCEITVDECRIERKDNRVSILHGCFPMPCSATDSVSNTGLAAIMVPDFIPYLFYFLFLVVVAVVVVVVVATAALSCLGCPSSEYLHVHGETE